MEEWRNGRIDKIGVWSRVEYTVDLGEEGWRNGKIEGEEDVQMEGWKNGEIAFWRAG